MFDVRTEPENALMRIVVSGFWNLAVFERYVDAVRCAFAQLGATGKCRRVLVDMSDYPIQSAAIAAAHTRFLRHARDKQGMRAAILMTSALSKLQASRVATGTGHAVFLDADEAHAWLLAG